MAPSRRSSAAASLTQELAEWASGLDAAAIPEATQQRAGWQWASVIGSVLAAQSHPHAGAIVATARRTGGGGSSTVIGDGAAASAEAAVWANTARSVLLDFDDYLFAGHTGHSAVLVALAVGEMLDSPGTDLVAATVAANEAGGRLGASMLLGPHNGQMWAYIHNLCGAVAASRLLHLDAATTAAAIGLAMTQPPYPMPATFMGSDGKALTASGPSVDGMRAAFLAADGLRCDIDALTDRNGFFAKFHPDAMVGFFSGYGDAWLTDSLSYKVYPGCAYLDTAVDATLAILERRNVAAGDVVSGRIDAGLLTSGMEQMSGWYRGDGGSLREINMNFSAAYSVAIALTAGRLTAAELDPSWWEPRAGDLDGLAKRIDVVLDSEMTMAMQPASHGPGSFNLMTALAGAKTERVLDGVSFAGHESRFPARVTLELADGSTEQETCFVPRGGAGRPAEETRGLVRAKLVDGGGAPPESFAALEQLAALASAREALTGGLRTPG